jgi:hypothetical protein
MMTNSRKDWPELGKWYWIIARKRKVLYGVHTYRELSLSHPGKNWYYFKTDEGKVLRVRGNSFFRTLYLAMDEVFKRDSKSNRDTGRFL